MKPEFNHCYTPDPGHRFHSRLGKLGFTLDPKTVEHPGKHSCRFIMLTSRDRRLRLYLEFVSAPPRDSKRPGVSFSVKGSLETYFKALRGDRLLRPHFKHRNYEWKTRGTKDHLPGWNFLSFKRQAPFAQVWFTEYEDYPGRAKLQKSRRRLMRHANGALGIVALEFDADPAGRRYLEAALRRKLAPVTRLACGTDLILTPARRTAFRRVVVKVRSLAAFRRRAKSATTAEHRGRPALLIKNPAGFWDLAAV
ncbi:hypothetical protein EPO15_15720 [bacterium]|nr:MAG: hypothetical protein EPO15_15720 [bacterium]